MTFVIEWVLIIKLLFIWLWISETYKKLCKYETMSCYVFSMQTSVQAAMSGKFQATAGFQDVDDDGTDDDIFQKALKMALRCILSVIFHLSGFKL